MARPSRLARFILTASGLLGPIAGSAGAQDRVDSLPRIAIEEQLSAPAAPQLRARPTCPSRSWLGYTANLEADAAALDTRLAEHHGRKTAVWLAVTSPSVLDGVERWRAALQSVLAKHGGDIAIVEIDVDVPDARLAAYAVQLAATDIRADRETIRIAIGSRTPRTAADLYTADLAPYLDLLVVLDGADVAAAGALLRRVDPGAQVAVSGANAGNAPDAAIGRLLDSELDSLGTDVVLHAWAPSEALTPALRALAPLAALMADDVSLLDPASSNLTLSAGGRDVTASVRHRLLFDGRTFATFLVYWGDASPDPLQLSLTLPVEGAPAVHRLVDGTTLQATNYSRVAATGLTRAPFP